MGTLIGGIINPGYLSPYGWWDFSDVSTLFNATSGGSTPSDGSGIARIEDKSGNGRHLTQATAAARPTRTNGAQNGLAAGTFDGGDSIAHDTASAWAFLHDGTQYIIAAAVRTGSSSNPDAAYVICATNNAFSTSRGMYLMFDDRASVPRNETIVHEVDRNVNGQPAVRNVSGSGFFAPNTWASLTVRADPSNATASARSSMRRNGGTAAANNTFTNAPSGSNPLGALTLGAGVNGTTLPLVGAIGEIIIVSGANATSANRALLDQYLRHKWAL